MAKDTEKLIRQLSLISYLMAERRPVTAMEIRRDVEGYSAMNEDAFARRFYADRAELESLGIQLTVDRPADAAAEQESYSLRSESFHLPAIEFTDEELAALQTALHLLDGEFAYAEPLRLALQQITWGRPSPLRAPDQQRSVALGITASAGGHDLSARLAKVETAIFRQKTITFDYYSMERDELGPRRVDPYHLLFQGGEFYLLGHAHERKAIRVFRLSRIRGKVAYATKAEHDFRRPADFDPRGYATRAEWQLGEQRGLAEVLVSGRIAWQIERHFGRYGEIRSAEEAVDGDSSFDERLGEEGEDGGPGDRLFVTSYASPRMLVSWVLGLGEHARLLSPPELVEELGRRLELLGRRHEESPVDGASEVLDALGGSHASVPAQPPKARRRRGGSASEGDGGGDEPRRVEAAIRPERFARLVTLAGILIHAGRAGRRESLAELRERLQLTDEELREDIEVLNVVNFGGGSYVLYAEILDTDEGEVVEVDPEPYSDNFDRPARLLPVEAKALIAAIDLIGEHIPEGSLTSAREKIVTALGGDPMEQGLQVAHGRGEHDDVSRCISRGITEHRLVELDYYKENEDEFSQRRVEPYALVNGREGWYVACYDPAREGMRHFRLDRVRRAEVTEQRFEPRAEVDPAAEVEGWMRTGEVQAARMARLWISPERARWARESRRVVEERADGSVVVELSFAGVRWLVREVLREAGDAAVLEPQDAREEVLAAVRRLRAVPAGVA
ncbi:MAG TPA: WYL domain-containing protein [Solirubrobacteraceae bacterium]|jgi:predicted DNA-binding transcriptional regulator YafY|nr:WYL domain-containing protein [Solirubrobacteraceae bacterium]